MGDILTNSKNHLKLFYFQSESCYVRHLKEEHNCTPEDLEEAEVGRNSFLGS